MQELAARVFPRTGYRAVGNLAWNHVLFADQPDKHRTAVWRDGDLVVAWAWLELPAELMLQVDPDYSAIAAEVLGWAEAQTSESLMVAAADIEAAVLAALTGRGYAERDGPFFSCLSMPLTQTPAPCELPPGYRIRPIADDRDRQGWVATHCLAFPGSRFDLARRQRLASVPPFRAEFDLIAEAPDETVAAYCLGWYDEQNRTGEFEPVGTHPDHRRTGLAAAVSVAVLQAFAAAGGTEAIVSARGDAAYPVPKRLYESLGFRERTRTRTYRRP
jgi:GNAT superfamily N-acetyltransferase